MPDETVSATTTINAPPEAVFAVLADPARHAEIDGTGWVREAVDHEPLVRSGQVFRVGMYHPRHPDGEYEMANEVRAFETNRVLSWEPGQPSAETGELEFGGWVWRYDLEPVGEGRTAVTLTYDWSGADAESRAEVRFPPFPPDHLANSLRHLAEVVEG